MPDKRRRIVFICTADAARALAHGEPNDGEHETAYAGEVAGSLAGLGHRVEIWAARRGDEPGVERLAGRVLVRRFRARCDYAVPLVRPCGWVSEFVAHAADQLAGEPDVASTLVTCHWEAGVAGRALARRFRLAHVHVPLATTSDPRGHVGTGFEPCPAEARRVEEERQTCHEAWRVIATDASRRDVLLGDPLRAAADRVLVIPPGHGLGRRFAAALRLPPIGPDGVAAASGGTGGRPSTHAPFQRRGPWEVDDIDAPARPTVSAFAK